jgi:hypothetical protein
VRGIGLAGIVGLTLGCGACPAFATDPLFMGRWAIDPSGCAIAGQTPQTTPLVVGDRSVSWFRSSCTIKKSYRIGNGLFLEAQCAGFDAASRKMPIGLQLNGAKLRVTWDQSVAGDMQRCR